MCRKIIIWKKLHYSYLYCVQFTVMLAIFMMTSSKGNKIPRYWPYVREIHRSPVNSPHKGQWRGALMLSLICAWINGWVNNHTAGDLRRYRAHHDVTVMESIFQCQPVYQCGWYNSRYTLVFTPESTVYNAETSSSLITVSHTRTSSSFPLNLKFRW